MIPFLKSVARAYVERYENSGVLSDTCFVFPNKRAGTFFLKYLQDITDGLRFAPCVTTISDLTADLSGRVVNTRLDTLFLLHKCYCEIVSPHLTPEGRDEYLSFDAFRRWGETVLSDFNEVDIHLAPADALFKNLFDFRSIASTFLTPDQRALVEEYFGYRVSKQYDDDRFWLEFGERYAEFDGTTDVSSSGDTPRSRFIHLWKVLSPLYERFHAALAQRGLTTSGGAYRLATENLETAINAGQEEVSRLLPYRKMVMIGFNALSMSERKLFGLLKSIGQNDAHDDTFADFIWDSTGPILSDRRNSAGRFIAINRRDFPSPNWVTPYMELSKATTLSPEIHAISSPSKVMQVKIAADIIGRLKEDIGPEPFDDARVAMVLPDESLLLPLLYSLPDSLGDANLTMGYPLKLTSVTSFLTLLRRMQLLRRDSSTYNGYAFEEVRNLLGHPYAHAIIGTRRIMEFISFFEHRHISVVKDSDLPRLGRQATRLLSPLGANATPAEVIHYLDDALAMIETALMGQNADNPLPLNGKMEIANVTAWRDALARLDDTIEEYGVRLSMPGTLAEAYRLLQGEIVAFEGEPLKGLQIMGMLETRALDFEHLLVVAVNDRTIPRRSRQRSFLPNVLRRGYGLPPINYAESLFAYYFYRMMSRAKKVTLIYDSRPSGMTGGPSRYLLQLENIYARNLIKHTEYKFALKSREAKPYVVDKSDTMLNKLSAYLHPASPGERQYNFSASTLKHYIQCPLKFYFHTIEGLHDDPDNSDTVDPITYGNLIHRALEILLIPDKSMRGRWLDTPITVTSDIIDDIVANRNHIYDLVHRILNEDYYHLPPQEIGRPLLPDTEIIAGVAVRHIINVLLYDKKRTPFSLYGCEIKGTLRYPLPDGRQLNMTYAIDRADNADCLNQDEIRIVDYKTGSSHISAPSLEDVFNGDALADHFFQLQLYADLLNRNRATEGKSQLSVKPVIYPVASIHKKVDYTQKKKIFPKIANQWIDCHDQTYISPTGETTLNEAFSRRLDIMLSEIFNPAIPFRATCDTDRCQYCVFHSVCRN